MWECPRTAARACFLQIRKSLLSSFEVIECVNEICWVLLEPPVKSPYKLFKHLKKEKKLGTLLESISKGKD